MSLESTNARPTVLVVEDQPDLADLYSAWLEGEYPVRMALDGEEALSELDLGVDIVLLDRRMPGLSGDEVLARIRKRSIECRVAMVTAVEPDIDIIEMGCHDYLVKPVTKADIDATVDRLTRRNEYDSKLDEYLTLVRMKSAIESGKTQSALRESSEFARLQDRIEELRNDVDPMVQEFDDEDLVAVLRDVEQ